MVDNNDIVKVFWNGSSTEVLDKLRVDPSQAKAIQNPPGWTLLHIASLVDRLDLVQYIIDLGAGVNTRDATSLTPLHYAVTEGKLELAEILLRNGADPRVRAFDGTTPLVFAQSGRHEAYDMIMLLCRYGAEPFGILFSNELGETIFHSAARANRVDVVSLLLKEGFPVDMRVNNGRTPLFYAVEGNAVDTAKLLLSVGADPASKDNTGDSPISWAMRLCPNSDLAIQLSSSQVFG